MDLTEPHHGRAWSPLGSLFSGHKCGWILLLGSLLAVCLLFVAQVPTDIHAQLIVAAVLLVVLWVLRFFCEQGLARLAFFLLGALISIRYILWRGLHTLGGNIGTISLIASFLLFATELYSITVYLLGIFVNIHPTNRKPVSLSADPHLWPSVDVLVPTYNESFEIVRATLLSALHIDYPREKLKVYLLDDGGTDQKMNDANPSKAAAAAMRRQKLEGFCNEVGVHYLTRPFNQHAKAGNINAALKKTEGELILFLDADHIPTRDILQNTVGMFEQDPKLFLVQTPHFFSNPDPIERNLDTFARMPSESEMFYSIVQRGLDFWNASFFCGSAGVMRRKPLEEIGGIAYQTVTEDAETSLLLHGKGYRSAYLPHPMISGLAPETFSGFITQRVRWAQGMVQIFFLKNPLFVPGLRFYQRLAYFSSSFFWFFPYARLVFLLAPVGYLVFGLHVYNASLLQILGYTLPHLVASLIVSDFLFGKVRWTFISELYEVMQSFFCFQGIIEVIRSPRGISFKVTPKGKIVNRDFISPLVGPFYLLLALTGAAVIDAVIRIFVIVRPLERYAVLITLGWALFNGIILLASLGALFERQQRRASARLPANYWATIRDEQSGSLVGDIHDLSEGGASLFLPADIPVLSVGTQTMMEVHSRDGERNYEFRVLVRNQRIAGNHSVVGLEFAHQSLQETAEKMTLVFGQSQRWLAFQQQRDGGIGIFRSFFFLLRLGFQGLLHHLLYHASNVLRRFRFKAKHVPLKSSAGSVSIMQSA